MTHTQAPTSHLFVDLFVVFIIIYAFLMIFMGPKRAGKAVSQGASWLVVGLVKLIIHFFRVLVMFIVNTLTLIFRLALSVGRPGAAGEAFSNYVERMADVFLGS